MNPGLVVKLRPSGPWRIGPDSGARNRVDVIYHSDSLYSAVTSAMSRMGRLEAWLDATARSATPEVCFSSCFPFVEDIGYVVPPRTVWPPSSPSLKAAHVRWKSARFIPLAMVQSILAGDRLDEHRWSVDGPSGCLMPVGKQGPFRTSVRWGAAVDRLSGASERHSTACIEFRPGAGLWTVIGFATDMARDQWQDEIKAAFRLLADTGFGGERSRGWGRSEAPEFIEGELPAMIIGDAPKPKAAKVRAPREIQPMASKTPDTGSPVEEPPDPEPPAHDPEPEPGPDAPPEQEPPPPVEEPGLPAPEPIPNAAATESAESSSVEIAGETACATNADQQLAEQGGAGIQPAELPPQAAASSEPEAIPSAEAAGETGSAANTDQQLAEQGGAGIQPAELPPQAAASSEPEAIPSAEAAGETGSAANTDQQLAEQGGAGIQPAELSPQAAASSEPEAIPSAEAAGETGSAANTDQQLAEQGGAGIQPAELPPQAATPETTEPEPPEPAEPEVALAAAASAEPEPISQPLAAVAKPRTAGQSHWMLSLFTPAAADTVDWARGSYTLLARGGRIDSPAGSGELKKQLQMIAEGSVLIADSAPRGAAPDVAPDGFAHPVFRAGFALAIPLPEGN